METRLYINGELADLPTDLDIRLNSLFIQPEKLIVVEQEYSYSITLPATPTNSRLLSYSNVESVGVKFGEYPKARLEIGNTTVIDGEFYITEITKDSFKGSLLISGKKAIKDVFEDRTMADISDWRFDFSDFHKSVEKYNTMTDAPFIFPLVMNGLFPKTSIDSVYTAKDLYDRTVRLNPTSFMPSVNCMQLLKKLFNDSGFSISGNAFADDRLNKLYMSYKNENDYIPDYNYGEFGKVSVEVNFANYYNKNTNGNQYYCEPIAYTNPNPKAEDYAYQLSEVMNTDLLSCVNSSVNEYDYGGNIKSEKVNFTDSQDGNKIKQYTTRYIHIPIAGYYKIKMKGRLDFHYQGTANKQTIMSNGFGQEIKYQSPLFYDEKNPKDLYYSTFKARRSEIKLVRTNKDNSFNVAEMDIDRGFYTDAINQKYDDIKSTTSLFHFPEATKTMFIDPKQDENLICGLSFGTAYDRPSLLFENDTTIAEADTLANPIVLKGGYSKVDRNSKDEYLIAAQSNGYIAMQYQADGTYSKEQSDEMYTNLINTDEANNIAKCDADLKGGDGQIECVVWLEANDQLSLYFSTDYAYNFFYDQNFGALWQDLYTSVEIEPFMKNKDWMEDKLKVYGGTLPDVTLDWNDKTDFETGSLNIVNFLPQKVKIFDWVDNLAKALNLRIHHIKDNEFGAMSFTRRQYDKNAIEFDEIANIDERINSPITLPYIYDISFSINKDEQGYVETEYTGNGKYRTQNKSGDTLTQSSTFSYCWYKDIHFTADGTDRIIQVPIISDKEPFKVKDTRDYAKQMENLYYDLAQRFWYKSELITLPNIGDKDMKAVLVNNTFDGRSVLDYEDKDNTLFRNFFSSLILTQNSSTDVECFLTPEQYKRLANTYVRFNGSIYCCIDIKEYDPYMKQKCTVRLVREAL